METKQKLAIGFLTLLVLTSTAIVTLNNQVRLRVDNDKSTFYVPHEDFSWIWTVSGREYNYLFDGSAKMNRQTSSIKVWTEIDGNDVWIYRNTTYIRGPVITDTYHFQGDISDVRLFPLSHKVEIFNAKDFFYRYEVRDLTYDGESYKLSGETELNFGKNMKVELNPNYRWAWVYKSGVLRAQYDIKSDHETFYVRLFDPPSYTWCYQETANVSTACGGLSTGTYATDNDGTSEAIGHFYINYSKPATATTAKWQVKHGKNYTAPYNITINQSCFDAFANQISVRIKSWYVDTPNSYSQPYCYNGSAWIEVGTQKSGTVVSGSTETAFKYLYDGDWTTFAHASNFQPGVWTGFDIDGLNPSYGGRDIYEEAMIWNLTSDCSPTLDTDWIISTAINCDGVEITTGTGHTIINDGNLTLDNGANLTTEQLEINTTGDRVFINSGCQIII